MEALDGTVTPVRFEVNLSLLVVFGSTGVKLREDMMECSDGDDGKCDLNVGEGKEMVRFIFFSFIRSRLLYARYHDLHEDSSVARCLKVNAMAHATCNM